MVDLGAIDEDVPFDNGVADALIRACENSASAIEGQFGSRSSWVHTAMKDFEGHFSGLFQDNANTARADARELIDRLREVATGARRLKEEARKEQERRRVARKWKHDHDHKSLLDKGHDFLFGEDDPPVGPPAEPVSIPVSPPRNAPRKTPSPTVGGGGGGGTSSARPADLHTFATQSRHANSSLRGKPGSLRADLSSFASRCRWGTLHADGVMTGFDKWLAANDEDVTWAKVIGDAFAKAGGEGAVSTLSNSALAATLKAHGVSAVRQDLTIPGPMAVGHPPTTGYAVDPVNTSTGNFVETESDLCLVGGCSGLELTRTYNSLADVAGVEGAFGPGWSSWTEAGLHFDDEAAHLVLPDGRNIIFARLGAGWDRATGENLWLSQDDAGGYVARDNQGLTWTFSAAGKLLERASGSGTAVRLSWSGEQLTRLSHERGRWIDLEWSSSGDRVASAKASDGNSVTYSYDARGRLVGATNAFGTRTYRWDDEHGLINAVVGASGVVEADNQYDERGRVVRQRTPHGRMVRFVYLPGRVTVVSDEDGTRSNTWIADERGRLVGVVDADEQRQSMAYDQHGNLVVVTERDGSATVKQYDDRGRLVRTVSPTGADIAQVWDDHDRLVSVSAAAVEGEDVATTRFEYAEPNDRQPSLIIDPEGGRTQMTWSAGLLTRVVDPTGVCVRFEHDDFGDLIATIDAEGNAARLERDDAGRVVSAITPSGAVTRFEYERINGMLRRRADPDGGVWQFEHDSSGRLIASVDPAGARTVLEYGPDGEQTRTIDALGRAIERRFDDLGNLASVELPDGSQWHFAHDALSRLREVTDPAGGHWLRDYDLNGELARTVDPEGHSRSVEADRAHGTAEVSLGVPDAAGPMAAELRVDRLGRLVASQAPDGTSLLTRYDRCGRSVEIIDGAGGVTSITRDPAGRVVSVTRPGGGVLGYEYDACGRPVAFIDELGGRATMTYDANGRVVRQDLATGDAASWTYDACGRLTKRRIPGIGTATWDYDLAGRVVRMRDPRFGRREFVYDAAGQLVEAINGNGGVTRYSYDANGRAVLTVDPSGAEIRREFDAMNRLVAETDPLGRTTRAGYDAAGRQVWQTSPDGERTDWTYDADGQVSSILVDGRLVCATTRDLRTRRVRVRDLTQAGTEILHELTYDARGRLLSRTRDGRGLSWTYDADGRRASRVGPDGARTDFTRDAAGRLVAVEHPLLGRATFEHDAAGRVVSARAGEVTQTWTYTDGFTSRHTSADSGSARETVLDRDEWGRIVSIQQDGSHSTFTYDQAAQLIESRVSNSQPSQWRYDASGRLVAESRPGASRELSYDAAGQLLTASDSQGQVLSYSYDQQGRRTSVRSSSGDVRDFGWSTTGWLASVTDSGADGTRRRVTAAVDALGELARIDGAEVFFDTAAGAGAPVASIGGSDVVTTGHVTGVAGSDAATWQTPGWRGVRSENDPADPWGEAPTSTGVGPAGELGFAGLEWLGARVYDPSARAFLSADPLSPIAGAGWAGNPYAYGGNDPMHAADPTGLRPATDADLKAYAAAHQGAIHAVGHWVADNYEYLVGGAMVIAGGVLIATGVGGPAGMMLISAGADTIIQKATTGQVNWGEVAISGAMGAWGGTGAAAKLGAKTLFQKTVVGGMISGSGSGIVGSAYSYGTGPGPHTAAGYLQAGAFGGTVGLVSGGAGAAAGHGITTTVVRRALSHGPVTPLVDTATEARMLLGAPGDTVVLGRQVDTAVAADWPGHVVLQTDNWSPELNREFVQGAIDYQRPIYLASPIEGNMVQVDGPYAGHPTIFAGELDQLDRAGYSIDGDYMTRH